MVKKPTYEELEKVVIDLKRSERLLRERERKLEKLLSVSLVTIYRCEPNDNFPATFITENVRNQLGYEPHEFTGEADFWASHIHPDDAPHVLSNLANLFARGYHTHEYRFLHKDGLYRWMHDELSLIYDDDGKPTDIAGFWVDITERKRTEEVVQKSEERHRIILQTTTDGFLLVRLDGHLIEVNDAYCRMSGYSEQELLAMNISDMEASENPEEVAAHIQKTISQGGDRFESKHRRKDGSIFDVEISAQYQPEMGGCFFGFIRDITERKRTEEALWENAETVKALLNVCPDSIFMVNPEGILIAMNSGGLKRLGRSSDEIIGHHISDLIPADVAESRKAKFDEVFKSGKDIRFVDQGEGLYLDNIVFPIFSMKGNVEKVAIYARDITEHKRAEEDLKRTNEELSTAHRQMKMLSKRLVDLLEKDRQYIASELHDHIGQTLTSIKLNLETIHDQLKPNASKLRSQIKDVGKKAIQAIKDVKNISHGLKPSILESLGLVPALHELFDEAETDTNMNIKFFNRNVPKRFAPEKELAIYRITQEALSNIISHARGKKVFVNLTKKNKTLSLSIEDDGVGFDKDRVMKVSRGRGPFGLLIMRERAEQLDGEFTLESRVGKGTHLLVEIPL